MIVSGGGVTIRKSWARQNGGNGGVGRFLDSNRGRGFTPATSGTQSVMGSAFLEPRVLQVQGLSGLQADATAAVGQQVESNV